MVKKNGREARESSLASGWTVEGREADPAEEPSRTTAPVADLESAEDPSDTAVSGAGSDESPEGEDGRPGQLSNGALVLLGLIGGVYLLYTVVWFSWANYYSVVNSAVAEGSGSIGGTLQQLVFWITPFAPALWFLSVLALCRKSKLWKKALWLVVGAVVLVPLPMFGGMF